MGRRKAGPTIFCRSGSAHSGHGNDPAQDLGSRVPVVAKWQVEPGNATPALTDVHHVFKEQRTAGLQCRFHLPQGVCPPWREPIDRLPREWRIIECVHRRAACLDDPSARGPTRAPDQHDEIPQYCVVERRCSRNLFSWERPPEREQIRETEIACGDKVHQQAPGSAMPSPPARESEPRQACQDRRGRQANSPPTSIVENTPW